MPSARPQEYDVVVSNYNGEEWPTPVQTAFEKYMKKGGRFIVVHAANNSFPNWLEYNKMIGLGGWGGRTEKHGPYVYYDDAGKVVRNTQPGRGGSHGPQHAFKIITRDTEHPVTKGMPKEWLHAQDELYDSLRRPGREHEHPRHRLQQQEQATRADDDDHQLRQWPYLSHADGARKWQGAPVRRLYRHEMNSCRRVARHRQGHPGTSQKLPDCRPSFIGQLI